VQFQHILPHHSFEIIPFINDVDHFLPYLSFCIV
jgi:hypothetical protein